jgi:beta-1,2-mannobiose phosphorylase / 1,2-beta-oligomannan phosphorylase
VYSNKDAMLFPEPVIGPDGRLSLVLMHRPMYEVWVGASLGERHVAPPPPGALTDIWTVWLSYCALDDADWASPGRSGTTTQPRFGDHYELLLPEHQWEAVRLGGGTPPIRVPQGWFTLYHGIGRVTRQGPLPGLRYVAGALILDATDPRRILYRSPQPRLEPVLPEECSGVVADVVFPTAVDQHETYADIYYGMADACIGVARVDLT